MIKIAPSILAADFGNMADQIKLAETAGADWLHIDVMDGHFVPNLTMGPDMVRAVDRSSELYQDVHLMVTNPEQFYKPFAAAGADLLCFHIEVASDPEEQIRKIHALERDAGIALNPDCDIERVIPYIERVQLILLMSVFPGYAGQKFIPESIARAKKLREAIDKYNPKCLLEIDGGINRATGPEVIAAGVDVIVMGSAFFGDPDPARLVADFKNI